MIALSRKHWTVVTIFIISIFLSAQLLRLHSNPDATFFTSQWLALIPGGSSSANTDGTKQTASATDTSLPSPTAAYEILATQLPRPEGFDPTKDMFDLNGPPEHNPAGPRPDQIVLLTATDGLGHNSQVENIVNMAMHNRREYCARNGYINHFVNMSSIDMAAPPVWKKLPAIIETFQTYPEALWVWWLDLDALIMTLNFSLEDKILSDAALEKRLLRNEKYKQNGKADLGIATPKKPDVRTTDIIVAQDHGSINAGSFFLRRSEWTQRLLESWRNPLLIEKHFGFEEQDALIHVIKTNAEIREHVGIVGPRLLNCFWNLWKKGDLMIHFAGCWTNGHCQQNWNAVWKIRYGSLDFPPAKDETVEETFPRPAARKARTRRSTWLG